MKSPSPYILSCEPVPRDSRLPEEPITEDGILIVTGKAPQDRLLDLFVFGPLF